MPSSVEELSADRDKLITVIASCETLEQLRSALKMANLFFEKHGEGKPFIASIQAKIDELSDWSVENIF